MDHPHKRRDFQHLAQCVRSFTGPYMPIQVQPLIHLILWYLMMLALTAEVFIRRRFAPHYFNLARMMLAWVCFLAFPLLYRFCYSGHGGRRYSADNLDTFYHIGVLYLLVALCHLAVSLWLHRQPERWRLFAIGSSHLTWLNLLPGIRLNLWQCCLLEPLLFILLGVGLFPCNPLIGVWLMVAGLGLFLRAILFYAHAKNRMIETTDCGLMAWSQAATGQRHWGFLVTLAGAIKSPLDTAPATEQIVQEIMGGISAADREDLETLLQDIKLDFDPPLHKRSAE